MGSGTRGGCLVAQFKIQSAMAGLCVRCRESHVVTFANNEQRTYCRAYHSEQVLIRVPVVKCSEFSDKNTPSQYDMEKIAWTLITDKSGQKIGFAPPAKDDK